MPWYRANRSVSHGNADGQHVLKCGDLIQLPEDEAGDCFDLVDVSVPSAPVVAPSEVSAPVAVERVEVDPEAPAAEDEPKRGRRRRVEE